MTLEVTAREDGEPVYPSWALNEVTVEKASRERMLEVTVEIDGRPLSTWGCDGVVMATPTGSTAYAFSAGGPVVWPDVEALLLVPDQRARALRPPARRRPAARSSPSRWCPTPGHAASCGATAGGPSDLPPGARIEVARAADPGAAGPAQHRRRSPTGWWRSSTCPSHGLAR